MFVTVDLHGEVDGARRPKERAPPPGEQAGGSSVPGGDEVEDAPEKVVGELGQAVVAARRHRRRLGVLQICDVMRCDAISPLRRSVFYGWPNGGLVSGDEVP